jgi:hypothetical protein
MVKPSTLLKLLTAAGFFTVVSLATNGRVGVVLTALGWVYLTHRRSINRLVRRIPRATRSTCRFAMVVVRIMRHSYRATVTAVRLSRSAALYTYRLAVKTLPYGRLAARYARQTVRWALAVS